MSNMANMARKRSQSDAKTRKPLAKPFDEDEYHTTVLQLSLSVTEDEVDERIAQEAEELGLLLPQISAEIEDMTSSFSMMTPASQPHNENSVQSQSTAPTSCSSSEHRPVTQSSETSHSICQTPSILSETEKKGGSGFRRGFRKMAGFKKRTSIALSSSTLTSMNSDSANTHESDQRSVKSDLISPDSVKSSKSSWSGPPSVGKNSYENPLPIDHEALRRSMECKGMLKLRTTQLEERSRFLDFQHALVMDLRHQRDAIKAQKAPQHRKIIEEQEKKNEKAVEDLEARQLEDEMKMLKDHEMEKKAVMIRLRHMEAYCHNPTPPPTPIDAVSGRPSWEANLPERKVTEKDYHNLAQQYRERDAMESLQASKINVLRGKQKKTVESFIRKKDREIAKLNDDHQKELDQVDMAFAGQEGNLRMALGMKRDRLETRWRTQALIERTKVERLTGMKHAALPDVSASEDVRTGIIESI